MDHATRLKRVHYRAHHRGTREADMMIGGYFDRHHAEWDAPRLDWFEALLEEQDVDIMAWAIGTLPCPARWEGEQMRAMRDVDYVTLPE